MSKIRRDLSALKEKASGLLTQEQITAQMLALQQKEIAENNPTSSTEEEASTASYRKKYTTMMHPDLSLRLRKEALDMGISAAELLERILLRHFDRH
jgi:hypothetical protein